MNVLVQGIIPGILIGGLYAIMSLGVSLSWGALKIINLAQFSFILLGGYLTYQAAVSWEIDPFLAILFVLPLFFLVGALLQWFFDVVKVDEFGSLVVTFGLFIMLQSVVRS
ncbi:MAG: branched-chain amino acid ABC transporter permease, partial [Acidimicrobiia bacterium]|nr:branched-chain amino acid ABC transporter permease [Acidimicrobiia bacterium]